MEPLMMLFASQQKVLERIASRMGIPRMVKTA